MIKVAKFVGVNTDYLTAQAFIFPKNPILDTEEKPFLALIISGEGEDVFTKVRQISSSAEELFFSQEGSIPEKLLSLVDLLNSDLKDVENLELLIACLKDDILYIKSQGTHQAMLLRDGKISQIQNPNELISGYIKPSDKLLLINSKIYLKDTPEASSKVWEERFIENLIHTPIDSLEEGIEVLLNEENSLGDPISAVLIESQEAKNEIIKPLEDLYSPNPKKKFNFKFHINPRFFNFIPPIVPRTKKPLLVLAILFSIGLISFGGVRLFNYFSQNTSQTQSLTLSQAQTKLTAAQTLKDADQESAQKTLSEAKNLTLQVLKENPKNADAQKLLAQIDSSSKEILRIYEVKDPALYLSLDLIKAGFSTKKLSFSLSQLLLLDDAQKTLVLLDLKTKNNQILAGPTQLGQAKFASLNGDQALVFSEDKGVLKVDSGSKKVTPVSSPDTEWGRIDDLFGFGSNVYLLDTFKHQIWKYTPTPSSYSNKLTYLEEGQKPDFAGGKKLAIDYSVWVLTPGPQILKFTGGVSDFYAIGGIEEPVKELKSIFPTEDQDTIYLLDSENKRLVVTKKNGTYLAQYTGDIFMNSDDFAVDEVEKKIYLLSANKIYQIDLR